jgi:tRNA threonylcarbamoyladenosine modification (KEOPS) complex  Pcc1 subunit
MSDILVRIKRAVLAGHYAFSEKARMEMEADGLTELDVAESILNAVAIYKKLRSQSRSRTQLRQYLYVIQSTNLEGLMIYTKGKLVREAGTETYYFLISSKKAI